MSSERRSNMVVLKVLSGLQTGVEVPLSEGEYRLGSDADDDIQLIDVTLKPGHVRVRIGAQRIEVAGGAGPIAGRSGATFAPGGDFQEIEPLEILTAGTTRFALGLASANWTSITDLGDGADAAKRAPERAAPAKEKRAPAPRWLASRLFGGVTALAIVLATGLVLFFPEVRRGSDGPAVRDELALVKDAVGSRPFGRSLAVRQEVDGAIFVDGYVETAAERRALTALLDKTGAPVRARIRVRESIRASIADLIAVKGLPIKYQLAADGRLTLDGTVLDEAKVRDFVSLLESDVLGISAVDVRIRTAPKLLGEVNDLARTSRIAPYVLFRLDGELIEVSGLLPSEKIDNWIGFLQSYSDRFAEIIPLRSYVQLQDKAVPAPAGGTEPPVAGITLGKPADVAAAEVPLDVDRLRDGRFDLSDVFAGPRPATGPLAAAAGASAGAAPAPNAAPSATGGGAVAGTAEPALDGVAISVTGDRTGPASGPQTGPAGGATANPQVAANPAGGPPAAGTDPAAPAAAAAAASPDGAGEAAPAAPSPAVATARAPDPLRSFMSAVAAENAASAPAPAAQPTPVLDPLALFLRGETVAPTQGAAEAVSEGSVEPAQPGPRRDVPAAASDGIAPSSPVAGSAPGTAVAATEPSDNVLPADVVPAAGGAAPVGSSPARGDAAGEASATTAPAVGGASPAVAVTAGTSPSVATAEPVRSDGAVQSGVVAPERAPSAASVSSGEAIAATTATRPVANDPAGAIAPDTAQTTADGTIAPGADPAPAGAEVRPLDAAAANGAPTIPTTTATGPQTAASQDRPGDAGAVGPQVALATRTGGGTVIDDLDPAAAAILPVVGSAAPDAATAVGAPGRAGDVPAIAPASGATGADRPATAASSVFAPTVAAATAQAAAPAEGAAAMDVAGPSATDVAGMAPEDVAATGPAAIGFSPSGDVAAGGSEAAAALEPLSVDAGDVGTTANAAGAAAAGVAPGAGTTAAAEAARPAPADGTIVTARAGTATPRTTEAQAIVASGEPAASGPAAPGPITAGSQPARSAPVVFAAAGSNGAPSAPAAANEAGSGPVAQTAAAPAGAGSNAAGAAAPASDTAGPATAVSAVPGSRNGSQPAVPAGGGAPGSAPGGVAEATVPDGSASASASAAARPEAAAAPSDVKEARTGASANLFDLAPLAALSNRLATAWTDRRQRSSVGDAAAGKTDDLPGGASLSAALAAYQPLFARLPMPEEEAACWPGSAVAIKSLPYVLFWLDLLSLDPRISISTFDEATQAALLDAALNPERTRRCAGRLPGDAASRSVFLGEVANNPQFVRLIVRGLPDYPLPVSGVSLTGGSRYIQVPDGQKYYEGSAPAIDSRISMIGELGAVIQRRDTLTTRVFDENISWITF